jgi:AHBA synthesis associated protein
MLPGTNGRLQAIVFDLDGVLIDSEPLMRFAFAQCYRQMIGDGLVPIEAYLEHMGESFPRIMDHLGLPHSLWQPYRELCQEHIEQIKVFPEGRALLAWAVEQGLKLAILTGKDHQRTMHLLEFFGLSGFFDAVIASDELRCPKPDPEGMYRALAALDCSPESAVMIGDAVSDVLCAQRAGVPAIAVTWGIKPERVQTLCRPDYVVHSWDALCALLQDMAWAGVPVHSGALVKRGSDRR